MKLLQLLKYIYVCGSVGLFLSAVHTVYFHPKIVSAISDGSDAVQAIHPNLTDDWTSGVGNRNIQEIGNPSWTAVFCISLDCFR